MAKATQMFNRKNASENLPKRNFVKMEEKKEIDFTKIIFFVIDNL